MVGEPHALPFLFQFAPPRRPRPDVMVEDVAGNAQLEEVAPIETTLLLPGKANDGKLCPSTCKPSCTELGTLELRCLEKGGPGRWKLELNVRMRE